MTIMERKNEKDLRAYVRPEAEILVIKFGNICGVLKEMMIGNS